MLLDSLQDPEEPDATDLYSGQQGTPGPSSSGKIKNPKTTPRITNTGPHSLHEAVSVDDVASFSRPWFDWPNSMFVELCFRLGLLDEDISTKEILSKAELADLSKGVLDDEGWVTCGFRDDVCRLTEERWGRLTFSPLVSSVDQTLCLRFGTNFNGWAYWETTVEKMLQSKGVACSSSSKRKPANTGGGRGGGGGGPFDDPPVTSIFAPYHCAVGMGPCSPGARAE